LVLLFVLGIDIGIKIQALQLPQCGLIAISTQKI